MSYSQLMLIGADGKMIGDKEQRNASGSGPVIWTMLIQRYWSELGVKGTTGCWKNPHSSDATDALFNKWHDLPLRQFEARVLMFTYDNALLNRRAFVQMASAMRMFESAHSEVGCIDHLLGWAERLDELSNDSRVLGCGWYINSVNCNTWCSWDTSMARSVAYDTFMSDEHWWIDEHERWNTVPVARKYGTRTK